MSHLPPHCHQMAIGNEYLNAEYQLLAWYCMYCRISIKYFWEIQLTSYSRFLSMPEHSKYQPGHFLKIYLSIDLSVMPLHLT
jgi:hypothetical protein